MGKIIRNAIQCNHCKDIIESISRHDYKTCSCGTCSIDGGHVYLKRSFTNSIKDYTELSEEEEEVWQRVV